MIIIYFPKTLGEVSFEKAGKLFGGRKTELFRCVVFPSPKPPTFPGNDPRGFPFGNPKLMFFFLFFIFVTSGYLFWLFSYLYKHTPTPSKRTTKGEAPLESPRLSYLSLIVFLCFLSIFTNSKFPF